jgi:hypothetical protein
MQRKAMLCVGVGSIVVARGAGAEDKWRTRRAGCRSELRWDLQDGLAAAVELALERFAIEQPRIG